MKYIVKIKLVKQGESLEIPATAKGITLHVLRHGEVEPILVDIAWLEPTK